MSEENKTTEAQRRASRIWEKNNPKRNYYLSQRRSARSFIRNYATLEDLEELKGIIDETEEKLKNT